MIVIGIVLLLLAYLLPDIVAVPYGVVHALSVLGWLAIVVGIILLLLSIFGHPVGGRRYWY